MEASWQIEVFLPSSSPRCLSRAREVSRLVARRSPEGSAERVVFLTAWLLSDEGVMNLMFC